MIDKEDIPAYLEIIALTLFIIFMFIYWVFGGGL